MTLPDLEIFFLQFDRFAPVAFFVIGVFLAVETILRLITNRYRSRGHINARLRVKAATADGEKALASLLRERGLTASGDYQLPLIALNRLIVQSGISVPLSRLMLFWGGITVAAFIGGFFVLHDPILAVVVTLFCGGVLPLLVLFMARARRRAKIETQLPEAIDIMVRSMRSGHPLATAISLVAKEMPDPVGSEFGLVADEMTYGLDLNEALGNMSVRAGQGDLGFLVVAVSVQAQTGGNLSEILSNLSTMLRERSRMRRKIHSLSAEGRFSAIALSIIPLVLWGIISLLNPGYYGEVSGHPLLTQALYLGIALWSVGAFVMYKMVNFKI